MEIRVMYGRRSGGETQGRSNPKEPPRVVPVDFCLAPVAPTSSHFVPLSTTLYHFVPPGGKTTQKSPARRETQPDCPAHQGFPGELRRGCPGFCPSRAGIYKGNPSTRPMKKILLLLPIVTLSIAGFSFGEIPQTKCKCHCDKDPKCTCTKGKCRCHK